MGNIQTAEQLYQQALTSNNAQSIQIIKKVLQMDSNLMHARERLADIYMDQKDYAAAIEEFKRYVEKQPQNASIYYKLGNAYLDKGCEDKKTMQTDKGCYKEAAQAYSKSIELDQKNNPLVMNQNSSQIKTQEYIAMSKKYFNLGIAYRGLSNFEEATNTLLIYISLNKTDSFGYEQLANNQSDLSLYDQAIQHYHQALQIDDKRPSVYYNLALAYQKQKKYTEAQTQYMKCLSLNLLDASAEENLGNIYMIFQMYQNAIQHYKKAIKIDELKSSAYVHLGDAYKVMNQYQEAIGAYRKATEVNQKQKHAFYSLGNIYEEKNNHKDAIEAYQKAVQLDPSDFLYLASLGITYFKNNRIEKANDHLMEAQLLLNQARCRSQPYLKQKNISIKNIQYVQSALKLIKMSHKTISSLKEQYQQSQQAISIIESQERNCYQSVISFIDGCQNQPQNNQNSEQQRQSNIIFTEHQFEKRVKALVQIQLKQYTNRIIQPMKQQIQYIKKHMITIEYIQQIENELIERVDQAEKKINKLEAIMNPQQKLRDKIQQLKKKQMFKAAKYAKRLYWTFVTFITSYRLFKKGGHVETVGKVAGKISNILGLGKYFGCLGSLCTALKSVVDGYLNQSRAIFVQRINSFFQDMMTQRAMYTSISQMIIAIIQTEEYMKTIEQQKDTKHFVKTINKGYKKILNKLQGYQEKQNKLQNAMVTYDCILLMNQICSLQQQEIDHFKHQNQNQTTNLLILIVPLFINKRKKQEDYKLKVKVQSNHETTVRLVLILLAVVVSILMCKDYRFDQLIEKRNILFNELGEVVTEHMKRAGINKIIQYFE